MKQGFSLLLWGLLFWATAYAFGDARPGTPPLALGTEGTNEGQRRNPA